MGEAKRKKDAGTYFGQPGWAPEPPSKPDQARAALFTPTESPEEVQARAKVRRVLSMLVGVAQAGMSLPIRRR